MIRKSNAVLLIASLFVLLFVYTALSKWLSLESFRAVIAQSPLVGRYPGVIAWLLPAVELWVAGLLLFNGSRRLGLYASLALMILFTGYILFMLLVAPQLPCSCGGVLQVLSWRAHIFFNLCWILLALSAIYLDRNQGSKPKT